MKRFFTLVCIPLLCFSMLMVGCQKKIETTEVLTPNVTLESSERTCVDDCQPCINPCCCVIEVLDPILTPVLIQFCGVLAGCTGIGTCSVNATGNCPEIRGILVEEELNPAIPFLYCQEIDEAIRITNTESFDVLIRISCFVTDSTGTPSIINVLIPGFESKTILVNNNCKPEECN